MGVTLPVLFFWQPASQVSEASARVEESEANLVKTKNELKLQLLESRARAESLHEQILNYEQNILPQAEKRMKIAHGLVPSDVESLTEHRDALESVINLKMAALMLRVDYEKAIARLESL